MIRNGPRNDDPARDDSVKREPGLLGTRCSLDSKFPEDSRSCARDARREVMMLAKPKNGSR